MIPKEASLPMKFTPASWKKKALACLLSLLMLLPLCANAWQVISSPDPFTIQLQWENGEGMPMNATASKVPFQGFEDCYWVMLPSDAPLDALTLHISDNTGMHTHFSYPSGAVLPPLTDAGVSLSSVTPLDIMGFTAEGQPGTLIYLYVSTVAPLPDDPALEAQSARVMIRYETQDGMQVASPEEKVFPAGTHEVFAAPHDLMPGYRLTGAESQWVTVDHMGATPAVMRFIYAPSAATLRILYETLSGERVAPPEERILEAGVHTIHPSFTQSPQGHILADGYPASHQVVVDGKGASPSQIVFYYEKPVQNAYITVHYQGLDGSRAASSQQLMVQPGASVIRPDPQDLRPGYALASGYPDAHQVMVDANGASPAEVTFYYEYRALSGSLIVRLLEQGSLQPLGAYEVTVQYGQMNTIHLNQGYLPYGYTLSGSGSMDIYVDPQGQPDREAIFYCAAPQPTDAPVLEPVQIAVYYKDALSGAFVAAPTIAYCDVGQITTVTPAPFDLMEGYSLTGSPFMEVRVDEKGEPDVWEVTFRYSYTPPATPVPTAEPVIGPTAEPAPKIALVGVKYISPSGEIFHSFTQPCSNDRENILSVNWSVIPVGYELVGPEHVKVYVDENGMAQPSEVIFQFKDEVNAYVTIYFQDQYGNAVASPVQELCLVGNNSFEAHPLDLRPGYRLMGQSVQNVVLNDQGVLNPSSLVFLYEYIPTPSPVPSTATPFPYDYTPMDSYCYPQNDNINFRSGPTTEENNIISTVNRSSLAHIIGRTVNNRNEIWYLVDIGGQRGFLKETVVRVLSDAEIAALFNYTLAPTQVPTPAPTEIPDGSLIDLWAMTNTSVNFRKSPEIKNSNKISNLSKNTRLWVYSSQTVDGEKWYSVMVNGTQGYLMAQYVTLYSAQESALIQAQLPSPVPTQLPVATPAPVTNPPTAHPTFVVISTATPLPTASPSPSPAPYKGYALTRWQTALRTGVSQTDDTILEMLKADSLVYVTGQTYVDGIAWSSVQAVASGNWGYMIHESLRPITNDEARPYLESLQPVQQATATPVPEQLYGYAMTIGNGVPMRAFPDTNGEILMLLPNFTVTSVRGQTYAADTTWHMVQHNGMWGFIRQDQMRMLTQAETEAYEATLQGGTPTPSPAPTPAPVTQDSPSSYGHVQSSSGRVNLRSQPSTDATRIRLLDNYAFALVMGTEIIEGETWYHVSQAGTEGYIHGDYFKVLSLGELTQFLQSDEYLNANNSSSNENTSDDIQSVEDYNQNIWQNPALSASYEPFNPFATPTPDPERLPTPTQQPTQAPTPAPTAQLAPIGPQGSLNTPIPNTPSSASPWPWVLLFLVLVGVGGAVYAYNIHRSNERRRQAIRAQQARQARAAAQQPQMRAAQNNPSQAARYPAQPAAPYMPSQSASPRPYSGQSTGRMQPVSQPAARVQPARTQPTTNPYRPISRQQVESYEAARQETQNYRPAEPVRQETQAYRPAEPARQETQNYRTIPSSVSSAAHQRQRRVDRHRDQEGQDEE